MSEDFSNIKEGEEVYISGRYRSEIATVTRVTPTTFTAGKAVFYKDRGRLKGGDSWRTIWAYRPTPEIRAKVLRAEMIQRLGNKQWETLTDKQLAAICAVLDWPKDQA